MYKAGHRRWQDYCVPPPAMIHHSMCFYLPPFTLRLVWHRQVEVPPNKRPQSHSRFKTSGYFQKSSLKKSSPAASEMSAHWTGLLGQRVQAVAIQTMLGYGHWIWDIRFSDHLLRANCMLCLLQSQGQCAVILRNNAILFLWGFFVLFLFGFFLSYLNLVLVFCLYVCLSATVTSGMNRKSKV